jgi:hypothetical protein
MEYTKLGTAESTYLEYVSGAWDSVTQNGGAQMGAQRRKQPTDHQESSRNREAHRGFHRSL